MGSPAGPRGNHRGSGFRLHVGTALIARDGHPTAAASWGRGPNAPREVRHQAVALERAVSRHIAQMQVVCLAVTDRQMRAMIERGSSPYSAITTETPSTRPAANGSADTPTARPSDAPGPGTSTTSRRHRTVGRLRWCVLCWTAEAHIDQ
jgi:hypothetical protein